MFDLILQKFKVRSKKVCMLKLKKCSNESSEEQKPQTHCHSTSSYRTVHDKIQKNNTFVGTFSNHDSFTSFMNVINTDDWRKYPPTFIWLTLAKCVCCVFVFFAEKEWRKQGCWWLLFARWWLACVHPSISQIDTSHCPGTAQAQTELMHMFCIIDDPFYGHMDQHNRQP